MRDSLDIFQKTVEDYASNKQLQDRLLELLEHLYRDLENERSTTTNLQQQIQDLYKIEDFGITSKFAELKAEYAELQQKLLSLKNENDDLNIQLIAKGEEVKHLVFESEEKMKSYYQQQISQKDAAMKQKEKEVENSKAAFKQKEQKLYEDIQAAEAASAIELDKLETNFRKQLAEATKKLKESMDTCNVLRNELMSVKEQFVEYKRNSNQKIADLQRRLRESVNSEGIPTPKKGHDKCYHTIHNVALVSEERICNKYQPLDVTYSNCSVLEDKPVNLKKTPIYRGLNKSLCDVTAENILPPLVNLTDKPVNKRRRLYNPDDLNYLNVDEMEKNKK